MKNKLAEQIVSILEKNGCNNMLLTAVNSKTGEAFTVVYGDNKGYLNALFEELHTKLHEVLEEDEEEEEEDEFDIRDMPDELKALILAIIMGKK